MVTRYHLNQSEHATLTISQEDNNDQAVVTFLFIDFSVPLFAKNIRHPLLLRKESNSKQDTKLL